MSFLKSYNYLILNMEQHQYNRMSNKGGVDRSKQGGGGASGISVLFCVLSGLYYFNIENFSQVGQANYC